MDLWQLLFDVVVLLGGCLVLGAIVSRLGQSPLVGYLLAGMLLGGPGSLHVVGSERDIEAIAELGVSLLLFSLGLEFSWRRLRSLGTGTLLSGVLQVAVTLAAGALVGLALDLTIPQAVAVGAMVSLSSTACVLRVLADRSEVDSAHGRNSIAILLVQDVAVVPLALLMGVLAGEGGAAAIAVDVGRILLMASALIAVLWILLDVVATRVLAALTLETHRELTILLAIVTGLGSAWAAHAVGLSPALGAFVAGMFLGSSPFATQIRADVASLRVVLLTLFFGAAGMVADPVWIVRNWSLVLLATLALVLGKTVITSGIVRAFGSPTAVAVATGVSLAQVGEFAFVLGTVGRDAGTVSEDTYLLVVSTAIVTLFLSPYLVPSAPAVGTRLARWVRSRAPDAARTAPEHPPPDVLVVGFGPAGRAAARPLVGRHVEVLVLDLNQAASEIARKAGFRGEVGDATQVEVLEHAGVRGVKLVVITVPAHEPALLALQHVRRLAPHATTVVRSRYQRHAPRFAEAGAHVVLGDEEAIGDLLADRVEQLFPSGHGPPPSEHEPSTGEDLAGAASPQSGSTPAEPDPRGG